MPDNMAFGEQLPSSSELLDEVDRELAASETRLREMERYVTSDTFRSKSTKPNAKNPQGGIVKQEASIHISNLNPVDPKTGKATRIGRKKSSEGTLVRYSKKSGEEI